MNHGDPLPPVGTIVRLLPGTEYFTPCAEGELAMIDKIDIGSPTSGHAILIGTVRNEWGDLILSQYVESWCIEPIKQVGKTHGVEI